MENLRDRRVSNSRDHQHTSPTCTYCTTQTYMNIGMRPYQSPPRMYGLGIRHGPPSAAIFVWIRSGLRPPAGQIVYGFGSGLSANCQGSWDSRCDARFSLQDSGPRARGASAMHHARQGLGTACYITPRLSELRDFGGLPIGRRHWARVSKSKNPVR